VTRLPLLPGGELEYAVLSAIWEAGSASAPDIHATVGLPRGLAYTTVAKVLDRLRTKGLVARRRLGKAFVYTARVPRQQIERVRAGDAIRRLLGSEPVPAIATLVEAIQEIDPDLIDELSRQVSARRRSRRGS
jgi:BlaI family transcriptional regulator, penicillinase repressor